MREIERTFAVIKRSFSYYMILSLMLLGLGVSMTGEGHFANDANLRFLLETLAILLTAGLIPLSLKLFHKALLQSRELDLEAALSSYQKWSLIRIGMLLLLIVAGFLTHSLCRGSESPMSSTGLLCMVAGILASMFCLPSLERMKKDLGVD